MAEPADLWIFAYGSLMWRPDFGFAERHRAELVGYHRALCIWSHHYRGTVDMPGLVFGLDAGGSCTGLAYRIASSEAAATLAAVRQRELITNVYREIAAEVALADGRTVVAVTYAADRGHEQYVGTLAPEDTRRIVQQGSGVSGSNIDYVLSTYAHLRDLGVDDPVLDSLCAALAAR